jgi:hydrogenase maturation factor
VPQHNFHVMNIFVRTGHHAIAHSISTMDHCRISWGRIEGMINPTNTTNNSNQEKQYIVETKPLVYKDGKLTLGDPKKTAVTSVAVKPRMGDWVSIHWGYVCAVLSVRQLTLLKQYTALALATSSKII